MNRGSAILFALAAPFALVSLAAADDVHLRNGQVFEDVVAETDASRVVIRLEFGQLSLPLGQVERIERSVTPLESLLLRRAALEGSVEARAEEWLELARFAQARGLLEAQRDALLVAARLDPERADLAAPLRGLGYERDSTTGAWLPLEEVMARRGLVRHQGEWLAIAEVEQREAQRAAEREARPRPEPALAQAPAADAGPTDNEVLLAQVELLRDVLATSAGQSSNEAVGAYVPYAWFGFGPVFGHPSRPAPPSDGLHGWDVLAVRQPGSMIPMKAYENW